MHWVSSNNGSGRQVVAGYNTLSHQISTAPPTDASPLPKPTPVRDVPKQIHCSNTESYLLFRCSLLRPSRHTQPWPTVINVSGSRVRLYSFGVSQETDFHEFLSSLNFSSRPHVFFYKFFLHSPLASSAFPQPDVRWNITQANINLFFLST